MVWLTNPHCSVNEPSIKGSAGCHYFASEVKQADDCMNLRVTFLLCRQLRIAHLSLVNLSCWSLMVISIVSSSIPRKVNTGAGVVVFSLAMRTLNLGKPPEKLIRFGYTLRNVVCLQTENRRDSARCKGCERPSELSSAMQWQIFPILHN